MNKKLNITINGNEYKFITDENVFSPNRIDKGTLAMLSKLELEHGNKVLDLGCGYGVVGVYCASIVGVENVFMSDIDANAVKLARKNMEINGFSTENIVQSNGFREIEWSYFDAILSNPPYHEDFSVPKGFIEKGFNRLKLGGKMYMVTKRKKWYKKKLISIFGGVIIWEINGYFVFMAIKKDMSYAQKKLKKTKKS
ncbi:methyltransferase [Proteinivorax tanatarense]|uniref:Methyltransferase n=1 Tax=Proteinivorax tanatarense TaxID=1260629 RepID=A0AAU7VKF4_9FIRM